MRCVRLHIRVGACAHSISESVRAAPYPSRTRGGLRGVRASRYGFRSDSSVQGYSAFSRRVDGDNPGRPGAALRPPLRGVRASPFGFRSDPSARLAGDDNPGRPGVAPRPLQAPGRRSDSSRSDSSPSALLAGDNPGRPGAAPRPPLRSVRSLTLYPPGVKAWVHFLRFARKNY
jgi:hypothetical protein